jgi:phosphatidylserine/phosphatidylglycerophosphate/cardiolipin synthase-like enzyme
VTLILETPDDPGGPLTVDADHPFGPLKATANFYRWPKETREARFSTVARLHAKCVIADQLAALITSANLTSADINDNIEPGVLIEAGSLPEQLTRHIELLIDRGFLGGWCFSRVCVAGAVE